MRVIVESDPDPDASYLEQEEFEDRLKSYKKGDFELQGVRAEAEVVIEGITQTLTSGGLSGIESDSEENFFDEIIAKEWETLRAVLKTVGVPTEQLPLDVDRAWVEWRT